MRIFVTEVLPLLMVVLAALLLGYVGIVYRAIKKDVFECRQDIVLRIAELEARYNATLRPHSEEG